MYRKWVGGGLSRGEVDEVSIALREFRRLA